LINELRDLISENEKLSAAHKRRHLKRHEKKQSEFHQPMSELEQIWGLLAESGIVMHKFGEDVKPITDRVTEIGHIAWKVIATYEGIKGLSGGSLSKLINP
jgi:uncharacterized protein YukE